jgi:hypothetical protein
MTSSPTQPFEFDAVICRANEVRGPIRLPIIDADRFIREFDRKYRGLGISITSLRAPEPVESDLSTST